MQRCEIFCSLNDYQKINQNAFTVNTPNNRWANKDDMTLNNDECEKFCVEIEVKRYLINACIL